MTFTVGHYLAERLTQIGLKHHFAVAGDYNLILLDQLIEYCGKESQIYSCNELNCSFSAEGYARAHGAAAAIVTFSVGAISAMNGLGSAYAEDLPIILISGGPNSNDIGSSRVLHHTIGTTTYHYQLEMIKHITCAAEQITSADTAPEKIDYVIRTALRQKKPAYLEIACNISNAPCNRPGPVSSLYSYLQADQRSLQAAVDAAIEFLAQREKVVILVGKKIKAADGIQEAIQLSQTMGCAATVLANAKGLFPEQHPNFRGVYWGSVSSPGTQTLVENANAIITIGTVWNDYTSVGWSTIIQGENVLEVCSDRVNVAGHSYDGFRLKEFLKALIAKAPKKPASLTSEFRPFPLLATKGNEPLTNDELTRQVNAFLDSKTTLYAETGDSWFNAARMHIPDGAKIESEMQWGHIGWSVPAVHGAAFAAPERRHIVMVGDGSFQLTAQEVSQMIRWKLPIIIFLINNTGYVIEIKIHDGPYNYIQNWDYPGLMKVFNGHAADPQDIHNQGFGCSGLGLTASTGAELAIAIQKAQQNTQGPTLIECKIKREDCTDLLVQWGKRVAAANSRPAIPR